jgi:hypothetical protein
MKMSLGKLKTLAISLLALGLSGCTLQPLYEGGVLRSWFWSRLGWAVLLSVVVGVVVARLLCRLPFRAPLMDCNSAAWARFLWVAALLALVATPLLLWLDAWLTQPFGQDVQLGVWLILSSVILDWRTLGLMLAVAAAFYFTVALCTRVIFARRCNCRYAFFPKFGS